jgi:hypothetical protein
LKKERVLRIEAFKGGVECAEKRGTGGDDERSEIGSIGMLEWMEGERKEDGSYMN